MKLEIEGKLRQASFCSIGSVGSSESYCPDDDDGESQWLAGHTRKQALSISSDVSSSDQLIRTKQKRKFKGLGKSLAKSTRTFGSIVFGFFRVRGLFRRLRRTQHRRRLEETDVLLG